MKFLKDSKIFAGLVFLILIGVAIYVYYSVSFIFVPIEAFLASLFTPILISSFLFYIFLPVHKFLQAKIKSEALGLAILSIFIVGIIYLLFSLVIPSLVSEISSLIGYIPQVTNVLTELVENFMVSNQVTNQSILQGLYDFDISISNVLSQLASGLTMGVTSFISVITRSAVVMFTVPVILFFLYKDGEKFPDLILKIVPKRLKAMTSEMLSAAHENASSYIGGKLIVCLYVGFASYLIFVFLGIPNALLLGVLCGLFDFIPYFGPFLGAIPAFLIALTQSVSSAIILVIFITIVQLGESYLVSPFVMGKSLHMHPILVVFLLLFSHSLFGLIGMVLALPVYAILRSCAKIAYNYYQANKNEIHKTVT